MCRYTGYAKDQRAAGASSFQEWIMALFCFLQTVLLGSFAAILGAHRSEILDSNKDGVNAVGSLDESGTYETPYHQQ